MVGSDPLAAARLNRLLVDRLNWLQFSVGVNVSRHRVDGRRRRVVAWVVVGQPAEVSDLVRRLPAQMDERIASVFVVLHPGASSRRRPVLQRRLVGVRVGRRFGSAAAPLGAQTDRVNGVLQFDCKPL